MALVALALTILALGLVVLKLFFAQTLIGAAIALAMFLLVGLAYAPVWTWQHTLSRRRRKVSLDDFCRKMSYLIFFPPFVIPPFLAFFLVWCKEDNIWMGIFAFVASTVISTVQACRLLEYQW